jgi:hypothetical protein
VEGRAVEVRVLAPLTDHRSKWGYTTGVLLSIVIGAVAALLSAADVRPAHPSPFAVRVSGDSPFSADCDGRQSGTHYRNAAVEAWVAADPRDPLHLIGVWQQDRWSNGGASGLLTAVTRDGGRTWTQAAAPFSVCSGGDSQYVRASDPWVSIGPDGTAYQVGLSLTANTAGQAVLVSRSADGGLAWSDPVTLKFDQDPNFFNDKESITADPLDARYVYVVWDRIAGNNANYHGPAWLARTTDGGATWEPARAIFDSGANAQTIGNQIVVLPDGTLVNVFTWIQNATAPLVRDERLSITIIRSLDKGVTWSNPITVASMQTVGVSDVKTGVPLRTAALLPSIGVDPLSGALYVVWQDGRFSGGKRAGIALAKSVNGGLSWSDPVQVNQVPEVQAFTPAVAVGPGGTVAVTYYDFRRDTANPAVLMTSYWRLLSIDGGATWSESPLAEPFDFSPAPLAEGAGLFVGDYQGLAASGSRFLSFFVVSSAGTDRAIVIAATRPSSTNRAGNGHTEVNRYELRRHIETKERERK